MDADQLRRHLTGVVDEALAPPEGGVLIGWVIVADYSTPEDENSRHLRAISGGGLGETIPRWQRDGMTSYSREMPEVGQYDDDPADEIEA